MIRMTMYVAWPGSWKRARAAPRELAQLVVARLVPEPCGLVDGDPGHAGTASSTVTSSGSSVSMNELTEKTAFPAPATPYPGGGRSPWRASASR